MNTCPVNKLHEVKKNQVFKNSYYICTVCKEELNWLSQNQATASYKIYTNIPELSVLSLERTSIHVGVIFDVQTLSLVVDLIKNNNKVHYISKNELVQNKLFWVCSLLSGIPYKAFQDSSLSDSQKQVLQNVVAKYGNNYSINGELRKADCGVDDLIRLLKTLKTSKNDEIIIERLDLYFSEGSKPTTQDALTEAYEKLAKVAQEKEIKIRAFVFKA